MNRTLVVVAFASLVPLAACAHARASNADASGKAAQAKVIQSRAAGTFTRLDVRGPIDVVVHEGKPVAMSLAVEGIAADKVITRVEGDALVVDLDRDWCLVDCPSPTVTLDLDVPVLDGVRLDGSGDVAVNGAGGHAKVALDLNGSGDVRYTGAADVIACTLRGSGDVRLSGSGQRLEAKLSGSGDVDARAFSAVGGAFSIDGSGDVTADLHGGDMTVRLHGSGDLRYTGEAKITSLDVSGSGEVKHL